MKIAIVGWGVEGQSAYRYFGPEHDYLICNEEPRQDFPAQSDKIKIQFINAARTPGLTSNVRDLSYLNGIEACDKIIYTPTVRKNLESVFTPDNPIWRKATTNQHIFFETVKTKNIIGVTGSKGKGTTSTLIAKMLEATGQLVHLGGNIGRPLLDFVRDVQEDDWVVLELANFQLYKFPYSPHIGICLMITSEHMEWHPNMDDYVNAKANLFAHQKSDDVAIYLPPNSFSSEIAALSPGKKMPYFQKPGAFIRSDGMIAVGEEEVPIANKAEVKLLGSHNLENICAAITATWQISQDVEAIASVIRTFSGLEHRLEFVRELNGVRYYDDSFGTTPDTTLVALKSFSEPVILIAGGHDKGADYEQLARDILKLNVKHVIAIGKIGERITAELAKNGFNNFSSGQNDMVEIVAEARRVAANGDVVLLSAGTSSFGMFKDYKDRGDQFKQAVSALA